MNRNNRNAWEDAIVAERLEADRAFTEQVAASSLSNQSWELVMTAVEFEIEHPEDPKEATLVANTDRLSSVMSAIASIEQRQSGLEPSAGGIVDRIRQIFLGGDQATNDRKRTAEALAKAYAANLQSSIEEAGRWETVCELATEASDP